MFSKKQPIKRPAEKPTHPDTGLAIDVVEELKRCKSDPVYFVNTYLYIDGDSGFSRFKLWPFQEDTIRQFVQNRFNVILKARQLGISQISAAFVCWFLIFYKRKTALCIANKQDTATELLDKIKIMLRNIPEWLLVGTGAIEDADKKFEDRFEEFNKLSIIFKNGSKIKVSATTESAGRGLTIDLLVFDETASVPNGEKVWTALYPTIEKRGRAIALSCVTKDTYVFTDKGIQQVGDFVPNDGKVGDYEVEEYNIQGLEKRRKSNLFHNNGRVKTRKIITRHGELEGSENHKLWACKNGIYDWYRLDELRVGDWVSHYYGQNCWGNEDDCSDFKPSKSTSIKNVFCPQNITPEIAYFLGLYISEGSVYKVRNSKQNLIGANVAITCGDLVIVDALKKLGLHVSSSKDDIHHSISSKNLVEFLEYLGFDVSNHANEKIIPPRLFRMSKSNVASLLRGLFDGDGMACLNGKVAFCSTSKKLVDQIRILLSNFGILSIYYVTTAEQNNSYNPINRFNFDCHKIELSNPDSKKFYDLIGFGFERKQVRSKFLKLKNKSSCYDVLPDAIEMMKEMYRQGGVSTVKLKKFGVYINQQINETTQYVGYISRGSASRFYEVIEEKLDEELKCKFNKIVHKNVKWVPIKEIQESENETFDFSLPEDESDFWCHSVIYNGFLGHQTPEGQGNFFHSLYTEAEKGINGFNPIKLHWSVRPNRTKEWGELKLKEIGESRFAQEYDCQFLGSGSPLFKANWLKKFEEEWIVEPIFKGQEEDEGMWIWKPPIADHFYILSADTAAGEMDVSMGDTEQTTKTDYSAACIYDRDTGEFVAEYYGKIKPWIFAEILHRMALMYHNPLFIFDNSGGWSGPIYKHFIDKNYWNIYREPKGTDNPNTVVNLMDQRHSPGLKITIANRNNILSNFEEFVTTADAPLFYSHRLFLELATFIYNGNKKRYEAASGSHDDLVFAYAMALHASLQWSLYAGQAGFMVSATMQALRSAKQKTLVKSTNPNRMPIMSKSYNKDSKFKQYFNTYYTDKKTKTSFVDFVDAKKKDDDEDDGLQRGAFEHKII